MQEPKPASAVAALAKNKTTHAESPFRAVVKRVTAFIEARTLCLFFVFHFFEAATSQAAAYPTQARPHFATPPPSSGASPNPILGGPMVQDLSRCPVQGK